MIPFLKSVANKLLDKHPKDFHKIVLIFPTRRAKIFFLEHLSSVLMPPFLIPKIFSIDDFIENLSELKIIKQEDLILELFLSSKKIEVIKDLSFDEFLGISNTLLSDFNQLDLQLSEYKTFFSALSDTKAIEIWNPNGNPPSEYQIKYLNFWKALPLLHKTFVSNLLNQNKAYQGLAYRNLAENIHNKNTNALDHIWICGLNALWPSEKKIVDFYLKNGKAKFIWDIDKYYLQDNQESGKFLRQHKNSITQTKEFEYVNDDWEKIEKKIKIIGAAQNTLQAKIAGNIITELVEKNKNEIDETNFDLKNTAIVLADENLLIPVLNSLPKDLSKVNVTMGYPIELTQCRQLIDLYLKVFQFDENHSKSNQIYYYTDLNKIFHHPLINIILYKQNIFFPKNRLKESNYIPEKFFDTKKSLLFFGANEDDLNRLENLILPSKISDSFELCDFVLNLINHLLEVSENKINLSSIEKEALLLFENIFIETKSILQKFKEAGIEISNKFFRHFFKTLCRNKKIDFVGEPLQGLQIMGLLETRTLDFKNIVLLSCNEGLIPPSGFFQSFVPVDVRNNFNWQSQDDKESIYAYHFYRLLQRAENIFLIYNTETDEMGSGEPSRYITQLRIELSKQLKNVVISNELIYPTIKKQNILNEENGIEKSPEIIEQLKKKLLTRGVSATVLNHYRNCPLRFYYLYVASLKETEEPEDSLNASDLGTLIHLVFEKIYSPFIGKNITEKDIPNEISLNAILVESFNELFNENISTKNPNTGTNLLLIRYAFTQIKSFLKEEAKRLKIHNNEFIVGVELKKEIEKEFANTKINFLGKADRISKSENILSIFDYKTGSVNSAELNLNEFGIELREKKSDKAFQLLFYNWLFYGYENTNQANAAIINLRNHQSSYLPLKLNDGTTYDFSINSKTEEWISLLLTEMLNENISFYKTEHEKNCEFCSFKKMCNR
ncbi:MAG: PD-(D/E)XK nuclease family protein [Bacteroidota bacterium]